MIAEVRIGDTVWRNGQTWIVVHESHWMGVPYLELDPPSDRKGRRTSAPRDAVIFWESVELAVARTVLAQMQRHEHWDRERLTREAGRVRAQIATARSRGDDNERTIRDVEEILVRVYARLTNPNHEEW